MRISAPFVRWLASTGAVLLVLAAVGYTILLRSTLPAPVREARHGTLAVDGRQRTFVYYVPPAAAAGAPLVLALHPSSSTGERMRALTNYTLERLADEYGFIVIYPDGHRGHWHDCRIGARVPARREGVDDVAFVRALLELFQREHGAGSRVLAMGFSNGGHLAYRLALEAPELVSAIVAFAASLPAPGNSDCLQAGKAVSAMIVNGTHDPLSPYEGGEVALFGLMKRGEVLGSEETARYFARLAGNAGAPAVDRLTTTQDARTWIERKRWLGEEGVDVTLLAIHGGGHAIPQRGVRLPRILGRTSTVLDGPSEAWVFFERAR